MSRQVYIHASEVLTCAGVAKKDGKKITEADLGSIPDGAVVFMRNTIEWVGPTSELPKKYSKGRKINLKGKSAIVPGYVDCHTHLVFAGDRASEFASRCAGATYQEIAAKGGGIKTTVKATREASAAELKKLAIARLKEAYSYGVRTIEIKSGYGLSHESEIKVLKVIKDLQKEFPQMTLVPTYLGAHDFPSEKSRQDYIDEMMNQTLPQVVKEKLAGACDIFVDKGYYTVEEARKILGRAKSLGLKIKIHADELANTESAALAAELGALSADHLLQISQPGIDKLSQSQTVAVLLPGTAFYLKAPYAPARALIDKGAVVALSTDFNPGTCVTLSLPAIMTLAALYLGMTRAEILAAVTYNAAKALGLQASKGSIEPGKDADLNILPFAKFEESYYRFAWAP